MDANRNLRSDKHSIQFKYAPIFWMFKKPLAPVNEASR